MCSIEIHYQKYENIKVWKRLGRPPKTPVNKTNSNIFFLIETNIKRLIDVRNKNKMKKEKELRN
jgi:hypothetical protein